MSGTMQYRVNAQWDAATQSNVSPVRFFWEWINFLHSHPGMTIVEVGTGTTSHGSAVPSEWRNWNGTDDPTTLAPIALDPNSWVVFRAVNADPELNGGGNMPWEAKIQVTWGATGYSDPSGIDYGQNGNTSRVIIRSSPAGVWSGSPTWDFVVPGSEDVSPDFLIMTGLNKDYYLDLMGDDDTIIWKGTAGDFPGDSSVDRSRGGYLGMIIRSRSDITWPFWLTAGFIMDATYSSTAGYEINSKRDADGYVWTWNDPWGWPSFSLGRDDSEVNVHRVDTWSDVIVALMGPSCYLDKEILLGMLIKEEMTDHCDILGELRFFTTTGYSYGQNTVFGTDDDLIQICKQAGTYGGIAMPWDPGVVPIW